MGPIQFFDANCQIGRFNHRIDGAPYSVADALQDAEALGISQRLVYHSMAKEHNADIGNRQVLAATRDQDCLTPCWALATWTTDEMPPPAELIADMRRAGVRAVRFFRHSYHIAMADWALGELWTTLEHHRIPLILDLGRRWATMDPFDADEVHGLCASHPCLPVILVKHRIRYNRQVYQLMTSCQNVRLELSGYWHYRAVEEICGRFGDYRLLFGTNWPYMDSSFAIAAVNYAEVSRKTKVAVAGGNLRALLGAVRW
jgi:predicted TIM-barrel fold metal-dependent hydrolase